MTSTSHRADVRPSPRRAPVDLRDVEAAANSCLPAPVWDFIASGAGEERTVAANTGAFDAVRLRPRVMTGNAFPNTAVDLFGHRWNVPFGVAPMACHKLVHPDGEVATARAAAAAGAAMVVSMLASRTLEDIARAATGPLWLQLFCTRRRSLMTDLVRRAEDAGYSAVLLTVDMPVMGRRPRDIRNGFHIGTEVGPVNLGAVGVQNGGRPGESGVREHAARIFDPTVSWADLEWLRASTTLPVLVKGVLSGADAEIAVRHGADGVVVSNHGGRQLDGCVAAVSALPEVSAAVAGRVPVLMDGGVRRGRDVLAALAAGAAAVLVGRPVLWGLAADGMHGAHDVLRLLSDELVESMTLCGVGGARDVWPDIVAGGLT